MAYKGLQDFISTLEKKGELRRIKAEVDPHLEITEIASRIMEKGGPALLFEKVKGSPYPLAINLLGSEKRMALALNTQNLDEKAKDIEDFIKLAKSFAADFNLFKAAPQALPKIPEVYSLIPKRITHAPCQEVIEDVEDAAAVVGAGFKPAPTTALGGFSSLPVLTCWPEDGGPFLTLPLVCTESLPTENGNKMRNIGMYRMQVYDNATSGMHWHLHKDGAHFFQDYKKKAEEVGNLRMPVCVALGCDPALIYASTAPLPEGIWEMAFAGFLRGKRPLVTKATLSDILVPADAEFILEGYVDPAESRLEGPFGDHTGFYSLADDYPVFHLQRITRRKNPVYPATVVGRPPKEDCWMARATERLFLPLLKMICPDIVDLSLPFEGVFHNCAIVSIDKRYPGQARKVMHFCWGMGQMMYTKCIIVVDKEVDPSNYSDVAWRAFNNVDGKRDIELNEGPLDALDHSSPIPRYGTRIGIDATRKGPDEGHMREWPNALKMDDDIVSLVNRRWAEYGIE